MRRLIRNFEWAFDGTRQDMLVEDGRIVWRRPVGLTGVEASGEEDCAGARLAPGFIDAHCHILPTGLDLQKLHLGSCDTREAVLDAVSARHALLADGEWLQAVHYDQTRFSDGQHLTRHDLDAVSAQRPILLRHVNGHASVANSAALVAAGIHEGVEDPPGGTFVRDESGSLTGVLLERAHEFVTAAAPRPTVEQMVDAILAAGEKMREVGVTCATDMMTGRWNLEDELTAYRLASERGCAVRLRMFLQWGTVLGKRGIDPGRLAEHRAAMDPSRCAILGLKIFADGAIGSATAAIYGRYESDPNDGRETSGQLIYAPDRLRAMVLQADAAGYRLAIHSIGDYSTDLVLDAFARTSDPRRHRIEHAMILSDAQIDKMARIGCHCTMQPEFLLRFGHAYRRQLGPERSARLKRARSVLDAGVPLSLSSDRPIVAGDPMDGVRTAVTRPDEFDAAETVAEAEALRAYTRGGAIANGDQDLMGSLDPGQLDDFIVLPSVAKDT